MKLAAPGGRVAATVVPADCLIGIPPENGTTSDCWNSWEIVNLMNSHSAFLFLDDLNMGIPARPTGVPFVVCCGHGAMANWLLTWLAVSGKSACGQVPPPNIARFPAAISENWL